VAFVRSLSWAPLAGLALLAGVSAAAGSAQELEIYCIDVGQGDCTLLLSPTGLTWLFDIGTMGDERATIKHVANFLDSLGIDTLTYFGASHYHKDHIGLIDELIEDYGFSVRFFSYDRGWWYDTSYYWGYVRVLGDMRWEIEDGEVIDLGAGVTITCVAVNGNGQLSPPFDDQYSENDLCMALVVNYGKFDFFVAGDLSGANSTSYHDIETSVGPEVGDVDVYRVNHHGSRYSSNNYFLSCLQPEVAIISVGENSYGHPHAEAVDRINDYAVIYRTEDNEGNKVDGDIAIITDGLTYTVNGDLYECDYSAIEEERQIPPLRSSARVWPNPSFGTCWVAYETRTPGMVGIVLYDLAGRTVQRMGEGYRSPGEYEVGIDTHSLSSGIYFLRLETPHGSSTVRIVTMR
jgi:competence protein ComEC